MTFLTLIIIIVAGIVSSLLWLEAREELGTLAARRGE
jgi:hypothetical protein